MLVAMGFGEWLVKWVAAQDQGRNRAVESTVASELREIERVEAELHMSRRQTFQAMRMWAASQQARRYEP